MSTATLERTTVEPQPGDQETNERLVSFADIVAADSPQDIFDELSDNTEKVGELLGEAESKLAAAGAELKIGVMTGSEQEQYGLAKNQYEIIAGLIAKDRLKKAMANGPGQFDEIDSKNDVSDLLIESMKQVYELDHDYRMKNSVIERNADKIAKTRIRRFLMRASMFAIGVGAGYGLRQMNDMAKESAEVFRDELPEIAELTFTSVDHSGKQAISVISSFTDSRIDRYTRASKEEEEPGLEYNEQIAHINLQKNKQSVADAEEKLALLFMHQRLSKGVTVDQLVEYMSGVVSAGFDEFYGVSDNDGEESGMSDDVSGALASAPLDLLVHDDASPETTEVITSARKTAGYYIKKIRDARQSRTLIDGYPPDDVQ